MRAGVPPSGFRVVATARPAPTSGFPSARVDSPLVSTSSRRGVAAAVAAGIVALLLAATPVLAHAELVSSDPADGAQLATPPATITLTFSEGVVAARSSFNLTLNGQAIGTGKAAKDGDTTMTLDGLSLDPGAYVIQWTSLAEDGDLQRGTVRFTVLTATPAPSTASAAPTATPLCTDGCDGPSPAEATSAASPSPQASADTAPAASSGSDVLLPIVIGLLAVAAVGAFVLQRSRRA